MFLMCIIYMCIKDRTEAWFDTDPMKTWKEKPIFLNTSVAF